MAPSMLSLLPSRLSRTSWCHSQERAAKALSTYLQKGNCEIGQRADLTGCTPESGESGIAKGGKKVDPKNIPEEWEGEVELVSKETGEILMRASAEEVKKAVKETLDEGLTVDDLEARLADEDTKEEERLLKEKAKEREKQRAEEVEKRAKQDPYKPGGSKWQDPPARLYHATFASDKIASQGFRTADDLGGDSDVLGGSIRNGVSFTTKENAETYREGLEVAWRAAKGEIDPDDISTMLRLGSKFGLEPRAMRQILNRFDDKNKAKRTFKILQAVSLEGRKFPLFMGTNWPRTVIETSTPPQIVSIDSSGPDEWSYNPSETEWRIHDPKRIDKESLRVERVDSKSLPFYHQKNYGGHSYGCLMALLPEEARKEITDWCLENIADYHLAPEGRELTPHVTIKYGFTDDNDTTVSTLQAITKASGPIYLTIRGLRTFPEGKDGVPLVLDVDSPQLHALNSHISEVVDCVDKFPEYIPHITLAYLTQEAASLYLEESPPFVGKSVVCDTMEWTGSDDRRVSFSLSILPTFGRKSGESYFATCERDKEGHCLPSGESEAKTSDKPKQPKLEPSELSPEAKEDYAKNGTRAKAFKAWFGDWESDPENASKVIDKKTGEPEETYSVKKVFHGRTVQFDEFNKDKIGETGERVMERGPHAGNGFYFTDNQEIAENYAKIGGAQGGEVLEAYLNIRNPFRFNFRISPDSFKDWIAAAKEVAPDTFSEEKFNQEIKKRMRMERYPVGGVPTTITDDKLNSRRVWNAMEECVGSYKVNSVLSRLGYDGLVHVSQDKMGSIGQESKQNYGNVWVAFEPNQIKAVANEGTFDPSSNKINKAIPFYQKKAAPPQASKDTKVATGSNTKVSGTCQPNT